MQYEIKEWLNKILRAEIAWLLIIVITSKLVWAII